MASLLDNFVDRQVIGTGAGSTIFKGLSTIDGQLYAIKHVKWTRQGDERFLKQAANEYRIANLFDNDNIVKMFDFQRIRRYFKVIETISVMEYCPGRTLSSRNNLSIPDIIGVFLQMSKALRYMHRLGIVHTDVKPENVIVDDLARIKIIDFGVACRRSSAKDRVQGTPEFIAPEQLSKKPLDERTDIYNLGATMYKVITGKVSPENIRMVPPLAANGDALSMAKLSVRDHNADVPEKFAYVVEKCCRRSRSKRYQNMRDVEDALLACLREVAPPDHQFLREAV